MSKGETDRYENKQSLSDWQGIVESVAAFATAKGGRICIGVSPDGKRVGLQLGKGSLEDLANKVKCNTDPPQYPVIEINGSDDSAIVTLTVVECPLKPVWAFGRPYKRVGKTNQRLLAHETQWLMESTTGRTWDALPCHGFGLDDIDREAVLKFLRLSEQETSINSKQVLEKLGFLTSGGIANAAVLLFGRNPQRFFPDAQVKCARFKGTASIDFIDERTFNGTVLEQLESALAFIERNTRQSIIITGKAARDVVPEYPTLAIREALCNSICHRNYTSPGTVQVRIFDDRLEIWNPGTLPPDLSIEELYKEHSSKPRNRKLAAALHRARIIEQWGTGTTRIMQDCKLHGMLNPEFLLSMDTFVVRFKKQAVVSEEVGEILLNDRQHAALDYIRLHGRITTSEYQSLYGVGKKQAVNDINELIRTGILLKKGASRATYYVISIEY